MSKSRRTRSRNKNHLGSYPLFCSDHVCTMCVRIPLRNIPKFNKGSMLTVTLVYRDGLQQNVTGICLKKKNRGFDSAFVLEFKEKASSPVSPTMGVRPEHTHDSHVQPVTTRDHKAGQGGVADVIRQEFPLYAPYIKGIRVLMP
uniref:50S ribosomal protein L19 n=1 Tax=Marophrys sp. SRT127 TaxID=2488311 RepID=A0A455RFK0_9EUKA|nr:50S ribosomal protein L19 [Marophrys sp. SRT127]